MIIESMIELYEGCRSSYEERGLKLRPLRVHGHIGAGRSSYEERGLKYVKNLLSKLINSVSLLV